MRVYYNGRLRHHELPQALHRFSDGERRQVTAILSGIGAVEASAALAQDGEPAARAYRASRIQWSRRARAPARHAIDAAVDIAGSAPALTIAVASALAELRATSAVGRAHTALHVWAPIAALVGLPAIAREMEDLAFKVTDPVAYERVARFVSKTRAERERAVEAARSALSSELAHYGVQATTSGRAKHLYSIHEKLRGRDTTPAVHDLFGLRIVVDEEADCYRALGVAHLSFRPLPARFKDYIARPTPSGYRALHTTVAMPPHGERVEIQIRSRQMHEIAEIGAASHVRYKHGAIATTPSSKWVYPLTAAGEVRRLPRGATALDFAYAIHSDLGRGFLHAMCDGARLEATAPLSSGDVVHVISSDQNHPTRAQLERVRTQRARNRIRSELVERRAS